MEPEDRRRALALLAGAAAAWAAVAWIVLTRDPVTDPAAGYLGALAMGVAAGLTATPLLWLAAFARRRIAYRGAWVTAGRRGAWTGLVVTTLVALRLTGLLEPAVVLFLVAIVVVAELALSADR